MHKKYRLLVLSFLLPLWLFSQDTNRVIKPSVRLSTEEEIDKNLAYRTLDSSSNRLEIFHPAYKKYTVMQDLGNMGLPARSLLFDTERENGFHYSFNPFEAYFADSRNTTYYNTKSPYSDITFGQGSVELIFLKLTHAQNILPRWNAGLDYQRITSEGFLDKQYSSLYNVRFFSSYHSKDKRYGLLANITFNRGVVDESGGIQSDSAFETLTGGNKKVSSNLTQSQTRFKHRSGQLKQYYRFGKSNFYYKENDTLYDFEPRFQISHSLHAEEFNYIFENNGDTNTILLPNRYYEIERITLDSAFYGKLSNKVQFDILGSARVKPFMGRKTDSVRTALSAGIKHELINVSQFAFVRLYDNLILDAAWNLNNLADGKSLQHIAGSYVLTGYNAGDYKLELSGTLRLPLIDLSAAYSIQQYRPDFYYQLFKANSFIWNNSFKQIAENKIQVGVASNTFRNNIYLTAKLFNIENWVYMARDAKPAQLGTSAQILRIDLSKTFRVWKFFLEHNLYYQQSSADEIRLPAFSGLARYTFRSRLFKVLHFQLGFDVFYNTAFKANAYNPSTRQFYLQDNISIGNYPLIDPFFIGDVKRASFFFKYEHVNQDLKRSGMYSTPHYPLSLSSFRMGVRWRFYD